MAGEKILTRGPTDNRNVTKKVIDAWDRLRGKVRGRRGSSNLLASRSTTPGDTDGGVLLVTIYTASVTPASPAQTVFDFTGTEVDGFASSSTNLQVFLNGVLLEKGVDYIIGSDTITLTEAIGDTGFKVTVIRFEVE
jgi:maltoporin